MYYINYDELYHSGVQGMKWGVRRYQNEDGSYKAGAEGRYSQYKRHGLIGRSTHASIDHYTNRRGYDAKRREQLHSDYDKYGKRGSVRIENTMNKGAHKRDRYDAKIKRQKAKGKTVSNYTKSRRTLMDVYSSHDYAEKKRAV